MYSAAESGHTGVVEQLLQLGASIEAMNRHNNTPLHLAALNGQTNVVELLLGKGAVIQTNNVVGDTPLGLVVKESNGAVTEDMYDTALNHAAQYGHTGIVKLLLNRGVSIDAVDR